MNIFPENLQIASCYLKEQSPKRKFEIENVKKFCRVFDLAKGIFFFSFSSFLASNTVHLKKTQA